MRKKCGFTGKKCTEHDCMFWEQFRGTNPNSGKEEDKWACTHSMMPVMLLEIAGQLRSVSAATESSRNEFNRAVDSVMQEAKQKALNGTIGA